MRFLLTILFSVLLSTAIGQTLVGYLKNSSSFTATAALDITPCNVAAYITGRQFKQVGMGDVIRDIGGTPINGGSTWWGYSSILNGTSSYRAYKIDGSGVVTQIVVPAPEISPGVPNPNRMIPQVFHNNSGAANCASSGFTFLIYRPADDPGIYENAPVYSSNGGGSFTNGTPFTVSYESGGPSFWTFIYSSTGSKATSVTCCSTNPITNAGADAIYDLGASINLVATATDCDGSITSLAWTQQSGPTTATITPSSNTNSISITSALGNLATGTYVFRITATDNGSNTATDDVTIQIIPAFVGTPLKIPILSWYCWTFTADCTRGVKGWIGDTSNAAIPLVGHKNGAWLGESYGFWQGDEDPRAGNFDHNSLIPGVQGDDIYPYVQRDFTTPYYVGGNGNQRVILVILPRKYDFHSIWWLDQGSVNLNNVAEVMVGSLEDIRKGLFQFDTHKNFGAPTIDYVINQVAGNGWYHYDYLRKSGQYILIRLNKVNGAAGIIDSGPGIANFIVYGKPSDDGAVDTRILPDYYYSTVPPLVRDTTHRREETTGFVAATGWPLTPNWIRDNIWSAGNVSRPTFNWQGGYLKVFASAGNPNVGVIDRSNTAWPGRAAATNKINLNPYYPGVGLPSLWKDSSLFTRPDIKTYTVSVQPNGKLLNQTSYASLEHNPVDSIGADFRLDSSYDRFAQTEIFLWAKIGPEVPDFTQGFGQYINDSRYESDNFPGRYAWNRSQLLLHANENNIGFRDGSIPNSSYMNPFALRAFHDKLYREWKKVFHTNPFVGQGLAAWQVRAWYQAQMLNNIVYMDRNHPLCDIVNVHVVVETLSSRTLEPGVVEAIGSRSEFGGRRNEGLKAQTFLDTLAYIMGGKYPQVMFSEVAMSTNPNYATRQDPGGSDASMSTHGARPIYNSSTGAKYDVYTSQGFQMTNIWTHQDGIMGMVSREHYEFVDAADTSATGCNSGVPCGSCPVGQTCIDGTCRFYCYPNSDANDGAYNRYAANYTPFFKPSYYIVSEDQLWKGKYRVIHKQSDSIDGQLRYLYRNVYERNKFLTFVQWQDSTKPANDRNFLLWADVSTCVNKTPSFPDATFSGTIQPLVVTAGWVTMRPTPEGNYIEFTSNGLASFLDGTSKLFMKLHIKPNGLP